MKIFHYEYLEYYMFHLASLYCQPAIESGTFFEKIECLIWLLIIKLMLLIWWEHPNRPRLLCNKQQLYLINWYHVVYSIFHDKIEFWKRNWILEKGCSAVRRVLQGKIEVISARGIESVAKEQKWSQNFLFQQFLNILKNFHACSNTIN